MITIRRANIRDIDAIMLFLNSYWKPGNILATDRDFFEWQFVEDDGKVNVFLGIDDETGVVYGTLGVILYNHSDHPDMSGCMWKTIKSGNPMLGLEIMEYANRELNIRYGDAPFLSRKALKLFKLQGKSVTRMDHYYRLNKHIETDEFHIAVATYRPERTGDNQYIGTGNTKLRKLGSMREFKEYLPEKILKEHIHSKDYEYIQRRFYEHPVYDYAVWAIEDLPSESEKAVMITRETEYDGAKAWIIVDYYGCTSKFSGIGRIVDDMMEVNNYEFIDVYSYGFPTDVYEAAGFTEQTEDDTNIIPNYFHPFVRENITLNLLKPGVDGMMMFRADGDQDRPG